MFTRFEFNKKRGRQCSPMMLQLRWYQLKKITRKCFYNSYVHNNNRDIQETLQSYVVIELTVLQIAIAVAYNKIITQEYPAWETLINEKRVILSEGFSHTSPLKYKNKTDSAQAPGPSNEPPVLLLKLDENQTAMDFEKINTGSNVATEGTIVIDLKDDVEYAKALQNMMEKSSEPKCASTGVETINIGENKEKFRLRLIRKVAKMLDLRLKTPDKSMWKKLVKLFGPECRDVWQQLRDVTVTKLTEVLGEGDVVPSTMQLSPAEWLLFDLVLVHDKLDLVNIYNVEAKCVRELFELVNVYRVENLVGNELVEAWINLTLQYNSRRSRLWSPMLLQLLWYQLKELSRQKVYKPSALLHRNRRKILIEIATKYQKIITDKWTKWSTRVKEKSVVLPEAFVKVIKQKKNWKNVKAREGWYLHVDTMVANADKEINVKDISENVNHADCDRFVCNSENNLDEIPKQKPKDSNHLTTPVLKETKEPEVIELDSDDEINEILRDKADTLLKSSQEYIKNIMNVSEIHTANCNNTIDEKGKNHEDMNQTVHKSIIESSISNNETILCDSDDEMDKLLQEKANLMSIEPPKDLKALEKSKEDEVDEFKKLKNLTLEMEVEEIGIINKETVKTDINDEGLDELDFDDNNIEFVDDGIKIEEGVDYKSSKTISRTASSIGNDDVSSADETDDNPEIDLKLLMNISVYTKKIDDMEIFKFIDYDSVNDKRVMEYVESESKPINRRALKDADIERFREQAVLGSDKGNMQVDETDVPIPSKNLQNRIKYTSWLLQKPKKRKYTSSQLSKNPDFNTQLKALTPELLNSTRNRVLIKKCQPVTIDLHKAFENKLINGTMYLKRGDFKSAKATEMKNTTNHEFTIPSISNILTEDQHMQLAEHVRNLIATITADNQDEEDSETYNVTPKLPLKRNKVINLPDKDQIRLINQSLLTAEITPRHQPLLNLATVNSKNCNDISEPTRTFFSSEELPSKRLKTALETSESCSPNASFYCCWAREKIFTIERNLEFDCSKHMCVDNCCTCCCRLGLVTLLATKQVYLETANMPSPKLLNVTDIKVGNSHQNNSKVNNDVSFNTKVSYGVAGGFFKLSGVVVPTNNQNNTKITDNTSFNDNITRVQSSGEKTLVSNKNFEEKQLNTIASNVLNYTIDSNSSLAKKDEFSIKPKVHQTVVKASTTQVLRPQTNAIPVFKKIAPLPVNKTAPHLSVNKTAPRLSVNKTAPRLSANKTAPRLLVNKTAPRVPVNRTAPRLPVNKTAPRVPVNKTAPRLPVNKTAPRLPVNKAAPRLTVTKIAPRLPTNKIMPLARVNTPEALKARSFVILPPGVNFVKLVDQKLAVAIQSGVQLKHTQLQSLMSVCASVNTTHLKAQGIKSQIAPLHYTNRLEESTNRNSSDKTC